ncbi:MAG: S41 family peptidase [Anaerolineae bacterium]|nr:S41 family peptidase [Anaerolineae bacterium]
MNLLNASRGRLQHISAAVLVAVIFFAGFTLGNQYAVSKAQGDTVAPADAERAFAPFWQVFNMIQNDYIDEVDIDKLVDGATKGLVDALGDQYSGYMNPEVYDLVNSDLSGEFNGIGVIIHTDEDTGAIRVVGLLDGAPAQAAGILPGDVFAAVDGEDVTGMNQTDLAVIVRGEADTPVDITMRRGDELIDFTIIRAHITVPNVETEVLDGNIGYIRLNQFTATARPDIDQALEAIAVNQRSGLILDLRDNPGGLLSSAIDVASAFIESGTVVTEDFGGDHQQVFDASGKYADIQVPIAVLVNEGSASASELLAGALQDRHVATIIGTTTLGKGTVQTWRELVNGGGIRLTIARWLTPDGHWIHQQGITPDISVSWDDRTFAANESDPQLDAAEHYLESLVAEPAAEAVTQ